MQIHTDIYRYMQIYMTDTYRYIQIYTDIHRYIQMYTDMCLHPGPDHGLPLTRIMIGAGNGKFGIRRIYCPPLRRRAPLAAVSVARVEDVTDRDRFD
jgi:hypothetical protein